MRKLSMPKRMLSGAFAAALACTMCPLAAVSAPEAAYAAAGDAKATKVEPINVTAPVAVIFGGSGYDVSNPQPSITTTTTFNNAGTQPIYVSKLECTDNNSGKILEKTGSTELADQKMFSMYPSNSNDEFDRTVSFGFGDKTKLAAGDIGSKFFIDAGKSLDCTFRLNLANSAEVENASLKVKAAAGEAEITGDSSLRPLAKVKYTFASYPTATNADPNTLDFYVKDNLTNKVFDLNTVNSNANSIAKSKNASPYYELYSFFAKDPGQLIPGIGKRYTASMRNAVSETGARRTVNILDVNKHDATNEQATASYGKTGITFSINSFGWGNPTSVGSGNTADENYFLKLKSSDSDSATGWSTSVLRARMNPHVSDFYGKTWTDSNGDQPYSNSDDDGLWNQVPESLQSVLIYDKETYTEYTVTGAPKTVTTADLLTIPNYDWYKNGRYAMTAAVVAYTRDHHAELDLDGCEAPENESNCFKFLADQWGDIWCKGGGNATMTSSMYRWSIMGTTSNGLSVHGSDIWGHIGPYNYYVSPLGIFNLGQETDA